MYNYGAKSTLRERFSSARYEHYFQLLDKEMYVKVVERELLDTLVDFLDEHNIDTFDLKDRPTSIINQGIIVQSGGLKAEALAVGAGAKAEKATTPGSLLNRARRQKQ